MPEKVTKLEKLVELAILKAKEVIQEATEDRIENKDDLMGEEVKVKRPTKNPKEVKLGNPVGKEGYGLAGQVSKMVSIHEELKKVLNPNITSNEALDFGEDSERTRPNEMTQQIYLQNLDKLDDDMDKLLSDMKSGKITDRQYVSGMMPLLEEMKRLIRTKRS